VWQSPQSTVGRAEAWPARQSGVDRIDTAVPPEDPQAQVRDTLAPSGAAARAGWAGRTYNGKQWTPALQSKYPNGVKFTHDGYPDFGPYATHQVKFQPRFRGDARDEARALSELGLTRTPRNHTWHHHQDTQTLQLVPTDLHDAIRHAGGASLLEGF
jgi:A nuclease of the HNH/ENDO VII superfamily with conserved WHH